jgi:ligand-binding SRPBCC domain-containing protein
VAYLIERVVAIRKPRAEVFAFFADAHNLERITPKFLHFHILTPDPIAMRAGTLIDYTLRLYGIPFRWQTRIEAFEPLSYFIDTQVTGPYRRWHHRHEFEDVPGGTLMRDHVEYEMPLGPVGAMARWLFVRRSLERIFDHRNATILEILKA